MTAYTIAQDVIQEEIRALERALQQVKPTFTSAVEIILSAPGKVVLTGVGKSGIIAHKIAATFASTGTPAIYLNASEALHGDLGMVSEGDVVVMLSKSATTVEFVKMIPTLKKIGVQTLGIFGNTQTPLAKSVDLVLDASVEREACPLNLAPMSSTTVALALGDALAAALMQIREFQPDDFALFHPAGQLGRNLLLRASDVMHTGERLPRVMPDAPLKEVLFTLTKFSLGAVCVCDAGGKLLGIITDGDIRRHLTHQEDLSGQAEALMTANPITLAADMRLAEVIQLMERPERQIYVAPVTNEAGQCLGLLRMHDIFQAGK